MIDRADIVQALGAATSDAERAAVMVSLPDAAILDTAELLRASCARAGFTAGSDYVDIRLAVLTARRDLDGLLPDEIGAPFLDARAAMARLAREARTNG